jgi:carbon-monoxide dehydrogenase medium subunit
MKPASFEYHAPETTDEAIALLTEHGDDAKVLAGGQSLIPAMNFRLAQPAILIDLGRIAELAYVRQQGDGLAIGTMTRQRDVETNDLVARCAPLVHQTMPLIAHTQIRNQGTFGGSIAHADPSAELPAVAVALDASCRTRSTRGERTFVAREFFTDLFETALEDDELLVEIGLPAPKPRTGTAFQEMARRHGDYALVGVAATVTLDEDGVIDDARLVLMSVGPGPVSADKAREVLVGFKPDASRLAEAAPTAPQADIDPPKDNHATPAYPRRLAEVLSRRALQAAVAAIPA